MAKTAAELEAERQAKALKDQIQKHRPHIKEEPGKIRKAILDAMDEELPKITEQYKESLKHMKAAGTESYADWPAAYGKIFQHAQQLGIMLGCRWGTSVLTPSLHDQPKQENIRIESNVAADGKITFDVKDVPDVMRTSNDPIDPNNPNSPTVRQVLEAFKNNTTEICRDLINDPSNPLGLPNPRVNATVVNGVIELKRNNIPLNKGEAEQFMKDNENLIASHVKTMYKDSLNADVQIPAPRI